ncbi:carboxymuconolactone decarboxylase family protein [Georgenia sp. SYP-B2076]|uniref:carboxymuconolactone decarboxylase family protein n=1 Tax=Georgenia sp. SYP-B2076 TaxID=2495881 RepID=UPI000F8CA65A|nr:carboxymuconolactone decarboxylase family protein [Georgenia sp. SYP-B2076]
MDTSVTIDARREQFVALHGHWDGRLAALLELSPDQFAAHAGLVSVPARNPALGKKEQHLVHMAVAVNATHMYAPGARRHMRAALDAGASPEEVLEVLQLVGTLGIHAMLVGAPILENVLAELAQDDGADLSPRQEELKAEFTANRGFWNADFDGLLRLTPDLFEAYVEYSAQPWRAGSLEPKMKELIYISFDVAATHLHEPGIEQHIRNALRHGASKEEIVAVMEIASLLGTHAVLEGAALLADELR